MDDKYPYRVYNSTGTQVMYAPADCRHDKKTEQSLLESGHTIKLHGKRIIKKNLMEVKTSATGKRSRN